MVANPAVRQRIGQIILNACAGTETETVILAQADALASTIGGITHLTGGTIEEAERAADECAEMIRQHIRRNWGAIQINEAHHA